MGARDPEREYLGASSGGTQGNYETPAVTVGSAAGSRLHGKGRQTLGMRNTGRHPSSTVTAVFYHPFRGSASSCAQLKTFPRGNDQKPLLLLRP